MFVAVNWNKVKISHPFSDVCKKLLVHMLTELMGFTYVVQRYRDDNWKGAKHSCPGYFMCILN